jgi:hypothetical protein
MPILWLVLIGFIGGGLSGFLGIGGATILLPALVLFFGFSQHLAQGTSLAALLLPVGLLAVLKYWQVGNVDIRVAAFLAIGFLVGGYFGAAFAQPTSAELLRKIFALYLIVIALQLLFFNR